MGKGWSGWVVFGIAACLAVPGAAQEMPSTIDPTEQHTHAEATAAARAFAQAMHGGMDKMMEAMAQAGMTGDPDVDFLAMMIPHHEGAVEMARLVLVYGKDPLVRRLAEEIIASQQVEIEAMRSRLAILRQREDAAPGGFPALHGTRGPAAGGER